MKQKMMDSFALKLYLRQSTSNDWIMNLINLDMWFGLLLHIKLLFFKRICLQILMATCIIPEDHYRSKIDATPLISTTPPPSLDSRLALMSSFIPNESKPMKDNTLEFLGGYHKTLCTQHSSCLKITRKGLNTFQVAKNTFKIWWSFHGLLYLCHLLPKLFYLIFKFKYRHSFYGETKDLKGLEILKGDCHGPWAWPLADHGWL